MRKWILVASLFFSALFVRPVGAEEPPAAPPTAQIPAETPAERAVRILREDLDRIFAEVGLPDSIVAVRVVALPAADEGAQVLYSVRADQPLVPASTVKLVTTAACWERLGPDWRIRTRVGHLAAEKKGDPPDLAVLGGGDPNFSGRFWNDDPVGAFRRWAAVLKSRGLTKLGRVLLDDGLFEAEVVHPNWPANQRQEWYEAPAGALNLNDNCVDVRLAATKAGEFADVRLVPPTAYVALDNQIKTVEKKANHRYSLVREILGAGIPGMRLCASGGYWTVAAPAVQNVAVHNPTFYFGSALAETLRAEGIVVAGPVQRAQLVGPEGVHPAFVCDLVHTSPLGATVTVANKRSQGFYAECLFKLLGAFGANPRAEYGAKAPADRPRVASWDNGRAEAMRWLAERGIPMAGVVVDDGSGLSKENRLTALAVTELLALMYERHGPGAPPQDAAQGFVGTLALAGQDGSLRSRMRNTAAEGNVWGKTGYVYGVSALSGYVRTRSGRWVAFSILMNDVPWGQLWRARLAQDKVCIRLVNYEVTQ
jgi:D-alanyl-D-alanine carboxypeptidase/D-alanyl-D-alanine-endopeptidase (penicillin-binding protein 4)